MSNLLPLYTFFEMMGFHPWHAAGIAAGGKAIEPTEQAYLDWNLKVEEQMQQMIWSHPKAKSYYLNSKGRNYVSCPFKLAEYWNWTRNPDPEAMVIT